MDVYGDGLGDFPFAGAMLAGEGVSLAKLHERMNKQRKKLEKTVELVENAKAKVEMKSKTNTALFMF